MGCLESGLGLDCRKCRRVWACVLPTAFSGPGLLFLSTLSIKLGYQVKNCMFESID